MYTGTSFPNAGGVDQEAWQLGGEQYNATYLTISCKKVNRPVVFRSVVRII